MSPESGPSRSLFGYCTRSGWNALLPERTPRPNLGKEIRVKYAIVGAGFTGLAAARHLSELDPDATVAVLDANEVGEGASARNSGFISPARVTDLKDQGRRLWEFTQDALSEVRRLVDELAIDCDLRKVGGYRCSATERGERELRDNRQFLLDHELPHSFLSRDELKKRIGTDFYSHGLFIDDTYLLQPAALVRGLADKLPDQVQLYENTPIKRLQRRHGAWLLAAPNGCVTADTVVLAAHSFTRGLGYLSDRLVAVLTYAALTDSLDPKMLNALGSDAEWGISPTFKYGTTMRRLRNGRLMVRSLYSYEKEISPDRATKGLHEALCKHFPQLAHVRFEFVWGGVLAMTRHRAPFFGQLDEKLFASVGCNGSGVAKFSLLGKLLAEEIVGNKQSEYVESVFGSPGWIPPEPLRRVAFEVISAAGRRFAGKDV
jgi:glycine/D-amino acid oxidase-like deaminating enzyme